MITQILHRLLKPQCGDKCRYLYPLPWVLPWVDDLLDRFGGAKFFTTLDLASGLWQIRVIQGSQEKTAFVVPQGLFEFWVMPFDLTNVPAVFHQLMQKVLLGLNPKNGQAFVSVYIDDILIFSPSLSDHLQHLGFVLERIEDAGLKLKLSKCGFVHQEVEYLGHVLTPNRLKANPRLIETVADFPLPESVKRV